MKKGIQTAILQHVTGKCYAGMLLLLVFLLPVLVFAQNDSTAAPEESSLISPSINFTITQKATVITLKADVTAKINGSFTKLQGHSIQFFTETDSGFSKTGEAVTNRNGTAVFDVKPGNATVSADGKMHFKASFAGNETFETAEEELAVKRGIIEITPVKEDSVLSVQLKLVDVSTGTEAAIPETGLLVLVKRMFKPLKIGEGTTDESGMATIEIPGNLPGDETGKLTLYGRLEDSDEYGNIEAETSQQWGIPVSHEIEKQPRALWSTLPPMWMLITFIVLMTTVWGHYFYIIYELVRLKKEHE